MRAAATTEASDQLDASIDRATLALWALQRADGHFIFELEADATIPAEYVLMRHYRRRAGRRRARGEDRALSPAHSISHGGWPLFHAGTSDISASVKAYFALKMIGDPVDAPHMVQARTWILERGGAANSNVFTRNLLALYGVIPWRGVPVMPVEIMLLPRWFPFHLDKVSYWARTVLVPLMVLNALKPRAVNPPRLSVSTSCSGRRRKTYGNGRRARIRRGPGRRFFGGSIVCCSASSRYFPQSTRKRAIERAVNFVTERLNGGDGLGAIFPAMVNALLMFDALGYPRGRSERPHGESRDRGFASGQ